MSSVSSSASSSRFFIISSLSFSMMRLRLAGGMLAPVPLSKAARAGFTAASAAAVAAGLFDLRFLEDDVLARDRVVLLEFELLGLGARVLLGHVIEAGVGAGHHLDQDRGRLGHGLVLLEAGKLVASGPLS